MSGGEPRLPDVLIAGVPKAGTSTLARWLGDLPEVYLPPDKEVHYFDEQSDRGLDWYRGCFAGPGRLAIDGTPTYALRDDWLTAAGRDVPDARFVILLRHPVERLWSAYWYLRSMGLETRSLEDVVDEGIRGGGSDPDRVAAGDYAALLDRLDRTLERERKLVLLQDDLADAPDETWARTCAFLGLGAVARPVHVGERLNVTGSLRSYVLRDWSMRLRLFRRTPRLAHALDRWNRTDRRPPPMSDPLRRRLLDHYEPSIVAVESRLARSLPRWRR